MAEKKPPEIKQQFESEIYKFGLELIDNYRTGRCNDRAKLLDSIVELYKATQNSGAYFIGGKE